MNGRRLFVTLATVFALSLVTAACSSNDNSGGASGSGAAANVTITVKDFQFDPSTVDVSSGSTTIEITNTGSTVHSFTLDDGSVSQDIQPGETQTVTVDVTADAGFHCKYHPTQMTGTLKVA
jgi:iron uptake system component EfeO